MRTLSFFRFLVLLLAFAVALPFTLYSQFLWLNTDIIDILLPAFLWLFVGIGWGMIQMERRDKLLPWRRQDWLFPITFALVIVSGVTHLPLRLVFWTQRATLQATENQLLHWPTRGDLKQQQNALNRIFVGHLGGSNTMRPFELTKSHDDTRFLLWENRGLQYKTGIGFAHGPNDAGCSRADFYSYWDYDGAKTDYVEPSSEYYWDYSHGTTEYVSLNNGWYATRVSVESVD